MKEITLKIPDTKLDFFLELVNNLGFEITKETEIPFEHMKIVRERIKNSSPANMVPWEDARKQLSFRNK